MKRKVIKQGHNTLTVTLPAKWVETNQIKAGDEIEIDDSKNELRILFNKATTKKKPVIIDFSGMNITLIRWAIPALEKYGFDEMEVIFSKDINPELIDDLIKEVFIGYIIVNQSESSCRIKNLTTSLANEFDQSLNRAFLVTLSMAKSVQEFIANKNYSQLKTLFALERTNNQLTNYCQRVINLGLIDKSENQCFLYVIVWNLEKICDNYKYICRFLSNADEKKPIKQFSSQTLKLMEQTNSLLSKYYSIYSNFDIKRLNDLVIDKKATLQFAWSLLGNKNHEESVVIALLADILTKISDFTASTFAVKHEIKI